MSSADPCNCDQSLARPPSPSRIPLPPRDILDDMRRELCRRARELRKYGDERRAEDFETAAKWLECVC